MHICISFMLKNFQLCNADLELSKIRGHRGQKGQIPKNGGNCLKHVQNHLLTQ